MPRLLPASTLRRLSAALTIAALAGSGALAAAPAQATTQAAAARSAACRLPAQRATSWREGADTTQVSRATRARVDRVVASVTHGSSARTSALPAHVRVPVLIHVIHGSRHGERRINKHRARRMFYTLKAGFAGVQNSAMAPTGVNFKLKKITITRNEKWFHAAPFSRADRQMKKRLHRGTAHTLNIYVNRPKSGGQLLLGFSLFPWQRRAHKPLDGVTISEVSLPGGKAAGYNLGDTVIHETGHWMGLLHTFEGGCNDGDGVGDTPAEATPSYQCVEGRNTCPVVLDPVTNTLVPVDDGPTNVDPIHNFMDYSYDFCMNHFTPGQRERMIALFMAFRYGR
ncbi:zinc metalloprotease [Marmoricola sp. URHA0025 HA25]